MKIFTYVMRVEISSVLESAQKGVKSSLSEEMAGCFQFD